MSKKRVDLDALVGSESLEIKIGGHEYVIDDIPIGAFLSYIRSMQDGQQLDEVEIAYKLLSSLRPDITMEEVRNMGVRTLRSLLMLVFSHFGSLPKEVQDMVGSQMQLLQRSQTGQSSS